MTQSLEAMSRRMTTLESIRGVVRTMKTLAAVNAAPFEAAARSIDAYHATILEGLRILMKATGPPIAPPPAPSPVPLGPGVLIVFGSDHGLCGGYNDGLADMVAGRIGDGPSRVLTVGARMEAALDDRGVATERCFQAPASADGIGRLAGEILIALDGGAEDQRRPGRRVTIAHVAMDRGAARAPVLRALLPLDPAMLSDLADRPWEPGCLPAITMDPAALLAALLRNHLFASVFRAAAEAMATENAARLALMQQAERAIDDRQGELLLAIRSARQSAVTDELMDVIAGFEALSRA